jgi:gas vesicle protein
MKTSQVVTGVLAGAAVGALIGVLFAPDKGSNTRKKITQKTSDYKQGLKNQVDHMVEAVTSPFHSAKRETNGQPELTRKKLAEAGK